MLLLERWPKVSGTYGDEGGDFSFLGTGLSVETLWAGGGTFRKMAVSGSDFSGPSHSRHGIPSVLGVGQPMLVMGLHVTRGPNRHAISTFLFITLISYYLWDPTVHSARGSGSSWHGIRAPHLARPP